MPGVEIENDVAGCALTRCGLMTALVAAALMCVLRMPRSALDYERVTRSFFAISTEGQGTVLYSRCNFASRGTVHCIDLVYPQDVARAWDGIVTRISRSLRPLEG